MIVLTALMAGVLAAAGAWLIMQRNMLRITLGFAMLSNAANLVLIASSGDPAGRRDAIAEVDAAGHFVGPAAGYVDPLPQALILTAIVISFAVMAYMIALVYRINRDVGLAAADDSRGEDAT